MFFSKFVLDFGKLGGGGNKHPNSTVTNPNLYRFNGTHPSESDNEVFLDNISKGSFVNHLWKGENIP